MLSFSLRRVIFLGIFIAVACVFSMHFLDQYLSSFLTYDQYKAIYRPVRELTELGVSNHFFIFILLVLISVFILTRLKKYQAPSQDRVKLLKLRYWTLSFLYSLLASGAAIQILKFVFGRQRPHRTDERNPLVFDFFTHDWHFHSFPSGHTQTVFAVATALAFTFPKKAAWFFSAAVIIAFTRVLLHEHFFSDLLAGGYIGYAMTLWIFTVRAKKAPNYSLEAK